MIILVFWILLCMIPWIIADNKGRSGFGWFILGALISPFVAIIILLCIGKTEERRKEEIAKEEIWRMEIQQKLSQREESKNDSSVNLGGNVSSSSVNLGKSINDLYRERKNLR